MLLAGDVGGTKTNLAIVSAEHGPTRPVAQAKFETDRYPSLEAVVADFLLAVSGAHRAGGVRGSGAGGRGAGGADQCAVGAGGRTDCETALGLRAVHLINDLSATGYAIPHLDSEDLHTLRPGAAVPGGPIAVVAPGTGLGESFLTWSGTEYRVHPTEGGHGDFAPGNALQADLLRYLWQHFEHVSYEQVCSGRGIPNLYRFLRDSGAEEEPDWLAERLVTAEDPTPVIVDAALDPNRPCGICRSTLEMFVAILGAEAGNLALRVLATGGVYLGGGIPPRVLPALSHPAFLKSFLNKGRLSHVIEPIPIHVILNPAAALLGAGWFGLAQE